MVFHWKDVSKTLQKNTKKDVLKSFDIVFSRAANLDLKDETLTLGHNFMPLQEPSFNEQPWF